MTGQSQENSNEDIHLQYFPNYKCITDDHETLVNKYTMMLIYYTDHKMHAYITDLTRLLMTNKRVDILIDIAKNINENYSYENFSNYYVYIEDANSYKTHKSFIENTDTSEFIMPFRKWLAACLVPGAGLRGWQNGVVLNCLDEYICHSLMQYSVSSVKPGFNVPYTIYGCIMSVYRKYGELPELKYIVNYILGWELAQYRSRFIVEYYQIFKKLPEFFLTNEDIEELAPIADFLDESFILHDNETKYYKYYKLKAIFDVTMFIERLSEAADLTDGDDMIISVKSLKELTDSKCYKYLNG
jgi:hypothetical protein